MTWLINEAKAVKSKFDTLAVPAPTLGEPVDVAVWFRNPENEVRDMTYPSLVLEYAGVYKADDREHRGVTTLPYIPEQFQPGPVDSIDEQTGTPVQFNPGGVSGQDYDPNYSPFKVQDFPVPYNIDFTVTLYTRFQTQLMSLIASLAAIDRIPSRFGYIVVPEDGTTRTMDLMAGPEIISSRDADGRRLFRAVYSVRVTSELNLYDVEQITKRIATVALDVHTIPAGS